MNFLLELWPHLTFFGWSPKGYVCWVGIHLTILEIATIEIFILEVKGNRKQRNQETLVSSQNLTSWWCSWAMILFPLSSSRQAINKIYELINNTDAKTCKQQQVGRCGSLLIYAPGNTWQVVWPTGSSLRLLQGCGIMFCSSANAFMSSPMSSRDISVFEVGARL